MEGALVGGLVAQIEGELFSSVESAGERVVAGGFQAEGGCAANGAGPWLRRAWFR